MWGTQVQDRQIRPLADLQAADLGVEAQRSGAA